MLMLACVHDPCINCAATAYAEQIHIKGQNREVSLEILRYMFVRYVLRKHSWITRPLTSSLCWPTTL